jgi:hypothetical protein
MAVVINEFEAVADSGSAPAAAESGGAKPKLKPADLRAALSRTAMRRARIWAH